MTGYYIYSTETNYDITYKVSIIQKSAINDVQLRQKIKDSINVNIFAYKLLIKGDNNTYYFKSESECNKFINDLRVYNKNIKTTVENVIIEVHQITKTKVLNDIVNKYRLEREASIRKATAVAATAKKQKQQVSTVSSRGGQIRVNNSGTKKHPLDSYTYISSRFGYRSRGFHTGVDFATPTGTKVHAWKAGTIIKASWSGGYGNYIVIQHGDGTQSCYAHLSGYACSVGDYVDCYDVIAYSGSTGNSTRSSFTFWNKS